MTPLASPTGPLDINAGISLLDPIMSNSTILPKPKALLFGLVFLAWMLPGLIGRDPWKADEAYTFGLVLNMVRSGDVVVPVLGTDPFMQKPPVFFITSTLLAKRFAPPLALHEAARLSCFFYMALTLVFIALASRELNGGGTGWVAALLLMGSVGLVHTAHMLQTDVSLLTGYTAALYGLLLARRRPWAGGLLCGTGTGLAFLSKGLLIPGTVGVTVLLLLLSRSWRGRSYCQLVGGIVLAVLPWVVIWPLALHHRSPQLFMDWFWDNNIGRFIGQGPYTPLRATTRWYYVIRLPGFAWPVCPLALWALWKRRQQVFKEPKVQAVVVISVVLLAVLSNAFQKRSLYATLLLTPLALLAVPAVMGLSERTAKALNLAVVWLGSTLAAVAWFGWVAQFTHWPASVLERIQTAVPGYTPSLHGAAFAVALAATLGWIGLLAWRQRQNSFLAAHWAGAVALLYLLGMTLWLPVTNGDMTYRHDFVGLREALGENPGLIGSRGLGEPQRAMLHYFAGLRPLREETRGKLDCRWMLIQGMDREGKRPESPGPTWRLVWSGHHHRELFRLYHLAAS